jgi:protein gp37
MPGTIGANRKFGAETEPRFSQSFYLLSIRRRALCAGRFVFPRNVLVRLNDLTIFQFRIDALRRAGATVKFLSLEPLLEALPNLDDRVIVGGESGPGARPIEKSWVIGIREKCKRAGVAFFFKQWGGVQKSRTGRTLEGRTWSKA